MSIDQAIREVVAEEVARALAPFQGDLSALQRLAAALGAPVGAVKRGPGRPRKDAGVAAPLRRKPGPKPGSKRGGKRRGRVANSGRACAVIGCGKPARSKGYCAAHYQKYRNLERTGRLPSDWKPDASPNSVRNVALPRGRAGSQAIAAARKR